MITAVRLPQLRTFIGDAATALLTRLPLLSEDEASTLRHRRVRITCTDVTLSVDLIFDHNGAPTVCLIPSVEHNVDVTMTTTTRDLWCLLRGDDQSAQMAIHGDALLARKLNETCRATIQRAREQLTPDSLLGRRLAAQLQDILPSSTTLTRISHDARSWLDELRWALGNEDRLDRR